VVTPIHAAAGCGGALAGTRTRAGEGSDHETGYMRRATGQAVVPAPCFGSADLSAAARCRRCDPHLRRTHLDSETFPICASACSSRGSSEDGADRGKRRTSFSADSRDPGIPWLRIHGASWNLSESARLPQLRRSLRRTRSGARRERTESNIVRAPTPGALPGVSSFGRRTKVRPCLTSRSRQAPLPSPSPGSAGNGLQTILRARRRRKHGRTNEGMTRWLGTVLLRHVLWAVRGTASARGGLRGDSNVTERRRSMKLVAAVNVALSDALTTAKHPHAWR